jgi:dTDP-4-dehydrorhamnose 3,5-epimerase
MNVTTTPISDVLVIEPRVFADNRGFFMETYHKRRLADQGIDVDFVQDNHSSSCYATLRGLHYQVEHPQGKLVRAVVGEICDVCVDLRKESATFGCWFSVILNETNRRQLYVPPGMAHGFCVLSTFAEVVYKCSDYYHPEAERTILWCDPELAIEWPIVDPLLSDKDKRGMTFSQAMGGLAHSIRKQRGKS